MPDRAPGWRMAEMGDAMTPAHSSGHAAGHPALRHHFPDLAVQKEASSLGMWVFLAQEVLFFGGMFTVYALYRGLYPEVFAACSGTLDRTLGAINTVVLICSSLTMALAVHAAALGHRRRIVLFLLLTILLGGAFLGVKTVEYAGKFEHHLVPGPGFDPGEHLHLTGADAQRAQLFFSLYFGLTGLHAAHMIIGIPILGWLAWRAGRGAFGPNYHTPVELTGLYWHFVDIVWIFLFPLLYLIGGHR
jgi:cytochrome c oxidase subunit III